jgi:hypothetical protein
MDITSVPIGIARPVKLAAEVSLLTNSDDFYTAMINQSERLWKQCLDSQKRGEHEEEWNMKLHKWDDVARSRVGAEKLCELGRRPPAQAAEERRICHREHDNYGQ